MLEFFSDWDVADTYFGVFVLWALAALTVLAFTRRHLAHVRGDVSRLTVDSDGHVDKACRQLYRPKWFDDE